MLDFIKEWVYYIFPRRCAICEAVIPHSDKICEDCALKIEFIVGKVCKRCGMPKKHCECKRYAYHFRGMAAPFENSGAAKEGIYSFKIAKNIDAAKYFAPLMANRIKEIFPEIEFDVVTAVPMSRKKRFSRGFDHTAILAAEVAKELSLPYRPLLSKVKANQEQHTLKAKDRFHNVKGAYSARENRYTNVLLVDDIKTTGATLDECSRRLMLSGTENVYCVTAVISACKEDNDKL